jgi:hypothetical protein
MIKKILFALSVILLTVSCSSDDNSNYYYKVLPVKEANVPSEFIYGQYYNITVRYIRPNDCHVYNEILYEYDYNARNIAVLSTVIDDKDCEELDREEELTILVHAVQHEPYIFRFWQGDDEDGEPIYLEIEVPVIH